MTVLALPWLRRIALGLPLTGITVLAACSESRCAGATERYEPTAAQLEALAAGTLECSELCDELQLSTGRPASYLHVSAAAGACRLTAADAGQMLTCDFIASCGGRPPAGLLASRGARARDVIGAHLAEAARFERASVPAFVELAGELRRHGAPRALASASLRAARDEVRHARSIERLAHAHGALPAAVERRETAPRSMLEMAEDNAAVGCVGEAHAALVAAYQASHARSAPVRAAFAEIARDEARHALLSFAIHDWARERLSSRRASALDRARRDAALASIRASEAEAPSALRSVLGLPDAERAVTLARALV